MAEKEERGGGGIKGVKYARAGTDMNRDTLKVKSYSLDILPLARI